MKIGERVVSWKKGEMKEHKKLYNEKSQTIKVATVKNFYRKSIHKNWIFFGVFHSVYERNVA